VIRNPPASGVSVGSLMAGLDHSHPMKWVGVPALNVAAAEYEGRFGSFSSQPLNVFQVPHHGSRSNVSPSLLDRLIGPIGSVETVSAVISSAKASPHHSSPKVTNALVPQRRTRGRHRRKDSLRVRRATPSRLGAGTENSTSRRGRLISSWQDVAGQPSARKHPGLSPRSTPCRRRPHPRGGAGREPLRGA
jgi:hypothetical protein